MKKNMQICWVSNMQTFTVKIYTSFLFTLLSQIALAQFQDDFSDNDFNSSPPWSGSDSIFLVDDHRLQLNGNNRDGVANLTTVSTASGPASWEFRFSFQFNPSSANYARVYLISDQPNLTQPLNGYFVMLGNRRDEVSLCKQTGMDFTILIDGRDDILNLSAIDGKVKVIRDDEGWRLFTDVTGGGEYVLEGSSDDNTYTDCKYFGILCTYTSTRSDKFFFDDFNVSAAALNDSIPPVVTAVQMVSSKELKLIFSKALDRHSATNIKNYVINDGVHPTEAILADDQKTVFLMLPDALPEDTHSISISGIRDLHENTMTSVSEDFVFLVPAYAGEKDVVMTEIFADPSPPVGLGESEYIEVFNRSDKIFNLAGWTISDGSSTATLPAFPLNPETYLMLTASATTNVHSDHALFLENFPTLNNDNDAILLRDENGIIIDSVNYHQSWYRDTDKEDGGWALELIDPQNTCSESENWTASEDPRGGTPGNANSVLANKPDLRGPKLISAFPDNEWNVQLQFDEKLEKQLSPDIKIIIDPPIDVSQITFSNKTLTRLNISLGQEIKKGIKYSVAISNVKDCAGNEVQETARPVIFGVPEIADSLEVIVNEILFNPRPTGVDFIEILNNSLKFINLKDWSIGNSLDMDFIRLTDTDLLLAPGAYLAITSNTAILKGEYLLGNEDDFFELKNLPAFNDAAGTVSILDNNGKVIDFVHYSKEMHSVFIKDDEGVSLERISNAASTDHNWKSASSSTGFATPGYHNSNTVDPTGYLQPVTADPEIFNPMSGQANFAMIHYKFDRGGYVANVKIFDCQGRTVKEIANNDILGASGFYRWDGDCDNGSKASLGSYLVWFEIFDENGTVARYQRRVAVASSFK